MATEPSRPSLVRKLGIAPGSTVALVGAPRGWKVDELPAGARQHRRSVGTLGHADVVIAFFSAMTVLERHVAQLAAAIEPDGALWVAWPRRAGGHHSDITDTSVRTVALPLGVVDVKVAALDDDWSGLKLVWRVELRHRPQ